MTNNWQHGTLYAITPTTDPLASAPEPYQAIETPDGWKFLYAPHLQHQGNGPHPTTKQDIQLAQNQGFTLNPQNILSTWTERNTELIHIAQTQGIIPTEPGPINDAQQTLRITHPAGRIANTINQNEQWPGTTLHIHTTSHGTFDSATIILRTKNPYQARSLLIMLGADRDDIADVTGITT